MSFVFVSHASEDKPRVKPLVEALARQGIKLWVDRPGSGAGNFNFDQSFIDRYGLQGLPTGQPYNDQISEALRECGLVLACISRALCGDRRIITQELTIGYHEKKLVACVVDDLSFSDIPESVGGLIDLKRIQAIRIDSVALQEHLAVQEGAQPDQLSARAKQQWDITRNLVAEINRKMPPAVSSDDINIAASTLARFPIFPAVSSRDIPIEIAEILAGHFKSPAAATNFLATAMQTRALYNPEGCTHRQILVSDGEVLNPREVPATTYWDDVLQLAGGKSPRTLAALLVAPGAPAEQTLRPELLRVLSNFIDTLQNY